MMKSLVEATAAIQQINILRYVLADDGQFPNNSLLPLLVYKQAIVAADAKTVMEIFESNQWVNAWEDGILDVHHYHSVTHEVLCVSQGSARVQFGGPNGVVLPVEKGDVIIIPAGVAHRCDDCDEDFKVVGAYPDGQDYDMNYGKTGERPATDEAIKRVPLPSTDPVYGTDGPLLKNWLS